MSPKTKAEERAINFIILWDFFILEYHRRQALKFVNN